MAAPQQKLHNAQRMSAAWRIVEPLSNANPKVVMRRYNMNEKQLKKAIQDLMDGNFKRGRNWNPQWDHDDIIHHPMDSIVMTDIEKGSAKGADIDLFMDPDFDPENGMCHFRWGHDEVIKLCEALPYRLLEIVRDSKKEDDLYLEAIELMQTPLFFLICKAFGIDSPSLLQNALRCRAKPSVKSKTTDEILSVDTSTGEFSLSLDDFGLIGDQPLFGQTTFN
jgi:hypothetical protein